MRNLKKILALVLALVMSLSLMATASAAETTAADSTDPYATAKQVLAGVKVFRGDNAGEMNWNTPITRVQTAALVYRINTGDVDDTKAGLHTSNPFKDVAQTYWGNSYISYGYNAGILKGIGSGNFNPDGQVTGYQTLAMILRAMGYGRNGEFEGTGWEVRTASTAQSLGLLKNVTPSDSTNLGLPASRGLVAEILLRAILLDTVQYSALNPYNYQPLDKKLAENLNLVEVEGVVTANEYADLYGTAPLAKGKTKLDSYTIETPTDFDDIGESKLAYIQNGTKVLSIADSGKNTTEETLKKEKLSDVLSRANITTNAETEQYVNFGQGTNWTSEWKIKYEISVWPGYTSGKTSIKDFTDAEKLELNRALAARLSTSRYDGLTLPMTYSDTVDGIGYDLWYVKTNTAGVYEWGLTYTVEFRIGESIGPVHQQNIKEIFNIADKLSDGYITGEVYAGTTSLTDVSDNMSFNQFMEKYIKETDEASVSSNENGNWLKVIDNDADGKADYVLKVIYTVAQVTSVKDDTVTLDTKNHTLSIDGKACTSDALNNWAGETVVPMDELAAEDVVYYAMIDGKAYAYKAEVVTSAVDKYVRKTETVTLADGTTEYVKSGVHEHIEDEAYDSNLENLAGKVSYDLFLDRGGFLAAFVKSEKASDYKLITDGWFNQQKVGREYAVRVYNDETGMQDIVDITANGNLFIGRDVQNGIHAVDNNDWHALKFLGGTSENDSAEHLGSALGGLIDPWQAAALNGGSWVRYTENNQAQYYLANNVRTTVAAITADGNILPVENSSVTGRYDHAMIDLYTNNAVPTKTAVEGLIYRTSDRANTAYNESTTQTLVRALNDTVYYVVYPTSATASGVGVIRTVGYANAPDVASFAKKGWVEDIYAVGTQRSADNALGTVEYSADVVVVELNQYDNRGEIVLVLDDQVKLSNVSTRELVIINEKGEKETRTVDLRAYTLSNGYYDTVVNGKTIVPGLYYMYKTTEDGIWAISNRLTDEQIRDANCFVTGYVKHETWTGAKSYVVVETVDSDNYAVKGEVQPNVSADTPMYTVKYGSKHTSDKYAAPTVTSTDYTGALYPQVDDEYFGFKYDDMRDANEGEGQNIHWYNYNRVLLRTSGSGVVYAVSFANVYDDANGLYDYARTVWSNVRPAPTAKSAYDVAVANAKAGLSNWDTLADADALHLLLEALDELCNTEEKRNALTVLQLNEVTGLMNELIAAIDNAVLKAAQKKATEDIQKIIDDLVKKQGGSAELRIELEKILKNAGIDTAVDEDDVTAKKDQAEIDIKQKYTDLVDSVDTPAKEEESTGEKGEKITVKPTVTPEGQAAADVKVTGPKTNKYEIPLRVLSDYTPSVKEPYDDPNVKSATVSRFVKAQTNSLTAEYIDYVVTIELKAAVDPEVHPDNAPDSVSVTILLTKKAADPDADAEQKLQDAKNEAIMGDDGLLMYRVEDISNAANKATIEANREIYKTRIESVKDPDGIKKVADLLAKYKAEVDKALGTTPADDTASPDATTPAGDMEQVKDENGKPVENTVVSTDGKTVTTTTQYKDKNTGLIIEKKVTQSEDEEGTKTTTTTLSPKGDQADTSKMDETDAKDGQELADDISADPNKDTVGDVNTESDYVEAHSFDITGPADGTAPKIELESDFDKANYFIVVEKAAANPQILANDTPIIWTITVMMKVTVTVDTATNEVTVEANTTKTGLEFTISFDTKAAADRLAAAYAAVTGALAGIQEAYGLTDAQVKTASDYIESIKTDAQALEDCLLDADNTEIVTWKGQDAKTGYTLNLAPNCDKFADLRTAVAAATEALAAKELAAAKEAATKALAAIAAYYTKEKVEAVNVTETAYNDAKKVVSDLITDLETAKNTAGLKALVLAADDPAVKWHGVTTPAANETSVTLNLTDPRFTDLKAIVDKVEEGVKDDTLGEVSEALAAVVEAYGIKTANSDGYLAALTYINSLKTTGTAVDIEACLLSTTNTEDQKVIAWEGVTTAGNTLNLTNTNFAALLAEVTAVAQEDAKAALNKFVEWALTDSREMNNDYCTNEGTLLVSGVVGVKAIIPAVTGEFSADLRNAPSSVAGLNLTQGIAEIEKLIDAATTPAEAAKIFAYDEQGNPGEKYTAMDFDSSKDSADAAKFGFTGNLKDYIMDEVQIMNAKQTFATLFPAAADEILKIDFAAATAELPDENVIDGVDPDGDGNQPATQFGNRNTHYIAATLRLINKAANKAENAAIAAGPTGDFADCVPAATGLTATTTYAYDGGVWQLTVKLAGDVKDTIKIASNAQLTDLSEDVKKAIVAYDPAKETVDGPARPDVSLTNFKNRCGERAFTFTVVSYGDKDVVVLIQDGGENGSTTQWTTGQGNKLTVVYDDVKWPTTP